MRDYSFDCIYQTGMECLVDSAVFTARLAESRA